VGERSDVYHFGEGRDDYEWNVEGPGTLDVVDYYRATYTATEIGSVEITFVGFEAEDEIVLPGGSIMLSGVLWRGSCGFEVVAATVDPTTAPPAPGIGYEVTAVVIVSTVEGLVPIGAESVAIWRFVFDCPDGRCDAEVHDGGPYGVLAPFMATYQADLENFVFDFVLDTPANPTCGDDRWFGEITPLGWDDQGPVVFTFTWRNELTCDTGDIIVEWEGEGTRG
jgi:hypothetical protein